VAAAVIAAILIVAAIVVSLYDRYSVQRTYADVCAARHGHIPPLADWFTTPDIDPEVERWRRYHRRLWIVSGVLVVGAVIFAIVARSTQG
jgi:hypothetical protein